MFIPLLALGLLGGVALATLRPRPKRPEETWQSRWTNLPRSGINVQREQLLLDHWDDLPLADKLWTVDRWKDLTSTQQSVITYKLTAQFAELPWAELSDERETILRIADAGGLQGTRDVLKYRADSPGYFANDRSSIWGFVVGQWLGARDLQALPQYAGLSDLNWAKTVSIEELCDLYWGESEWATIVRTAAVPIPRAGLGTRHIDIGEYPRVTSSEAYRTMTLNAPYDHEAVEWLYKNCDVWSAGFGSNDINHVLGIRAEDAATDEGDATLLVLATRLQNERNCDFQLGSQIGFS